VRRTNKRGKGSEERKTIRRPKGTGERATGGTTEEAAGTGAGIETTKEGSGEKKGANREDCTARKEEARKRRGDRSWEMKSESSRVREEETGEKRRPR